MLRNKKLKDLRFKVRRLLVIINLNFGADGLNRRTTIIKNI